MKSEAGNIFKVACIYITTIIGAGFASGQEIVQFFSTYYEGGFYGIILAGVLFAIIGYLVLDRVYRERIRNYDEFLFPTVGWFLGWAMEIIVTMFMFALFCVMNAGAGNVIAEKLGIPFGYGVAIMVLLCLVVILTDIKGVVAVSTVITPVLVAGILIVGGYIIAFRDTSVFNLLSGFNKITHNWFFSSLLYVSYNSILAVVILCSLLPYLRTRKVAVYGGVIGGAVLCAIAFLLNFALFLYAPDSLSSELPVLKIVGKYHALLSGFYVLVLWLAMLTSAVTSGFCFVDRIGSKMNVSKKLIACVTCFISLPLSGLGFSTLIATLYPIFGYAGLFLVFAILIQGANLKPVMARVRKAVGVRRR